MAFLVISFFKTFVCALHTSRISNVRCPVGFKITNDGKNCTDLDECNPINPCLNGGICTNFPSGRGFHCSCPAHYSGQYCNAQKVGKELQLSNAALIMIIICIVNIMSKFQVDVFWNVPATNAKIAVFHVACVCVSVVN